MSDLIKYADIAAWAADGEDLALTASELPWEIGQWYAEGAQRFGASEVIRILERNQAIRDAGGKPQYPYLARVSRHTCQNYATVWRAAQLDSRYREYDFFHVEAVLGIPDTEARIKLLNEGKAEQMSVGKFRRHRDQELGKLPPPPDDSIARLNGKVAELTQANHELSDAVRDYAAMQVEIDARLADDPTAPAEDAYERDAHEEWVTGRCECGGQWVCQKCGQVMG
jgi:hypothetical protein